MSPIRSHRYIATISQTRARRSGRGGSLAALTLSIATSAALALNGLCLERAVAGPVLVVDSQSGAVLYEERATEPWYPASVTKLMTVYVALSAVRDHRIAFDTPIAVSARAASMAPSKMGFRPGTLVTLDNALKMLMVKSANDMAVAIAEGVSGSVEAFADDMNAAARSLGMTQSHFVNPNGLPNPDHISSARDLAILALALYRTFPEHGDLFNIGALQLAGKVIRNHNDLLGRYPGADGMKTGFICASGFNIVASATHGGRKFIVVVLGAPNPRSRAMLAATLFDRAFAGIDQPSKSLSDLAVRTETPGEQMPSMQQSFCGRRGKAAAAFNAQTARLLEPLLAPKASANSGHYVLTTTEGLARAAPVATRITMVPAPAFDPIPVYLGPQPGYGGLVAQARPPHSPIGTPQPPGTATAYAPETPEMAVAASQVSPDVAALPLKGGTKHKRAQLRRHGSHLHGMARAEAGKPHRSPKKNSQKSAKTAQGKFAKGKKLAAAKLTVKAHSKIAGRQSVVAKTSARPSGRADKSKGEITKKQARR